MFPTWLIVVLSLGYVGLMFAIATWGDRRGRRSQSLIGHPVVYTLSLAVYCTAWTFYGSVGLAAQSGLAFLPVYLGATITALLFPFLLHKIVKAAKAYSITSIADFLAARYGKSGVIGGVVTIVAILGAIPYIALQLKALAASVTIVLGSPPGDVDGPWGADTALTITLVLAVFAILFGTRHVDATETHQGMVLAIAFESIVKLLAFLVVGIFVTFWLNDGFTDIAGRAIDAGLGDLLTAEGSRLSYADWFLLTLVSACAFLVLPRQFQVAVIENTDDRHLRTATWLLPTYLLIINIFVLPIALAGRLEGIAGGDLIILELPLLAGNSWIVAIVFIGGLSAATAMIIVATVALSTMISNDLVMPVLLRIERLQLTKRGDLSSLVLMIRRTAILILLILGYGFFQSIGSGYALVSIGLISFAAVAQFVPPIIAAIYWRGANFAGALAGILGGISIWIYTLILPAFEREGWLPTSLLDAGPWGLALLKPQALFALEGLHPVSHAVLWSLSVNVLLLVLGSLLFRQSTLERMQSLLFVDVYERAGATRIWRGDTMVSDLIDLSSTILSAERAERMRVLDSYHRGRMLELNEPADASFVQTVERQLARAIGSTSSRVMVASVVRREVIGHEDLMEILSETSHAIEYSQRLEQKSQALEQATEELKQANERLTQLDRLKDDFIATVSHELRTPLTSIRSFSEILLDTPDLTTKERGDFLKIVVRESERLTRLINDVLDLSKIESGRMNWQVVDTDLAEAVGEALAATQSIFNENNVELTSHVPAGAAVVCCDRDRLIQLIVNLLSNAVKFVPETGGRVQVALHRRHDHFQVRIEDNGPGVPVRFRHAIFEKFRQATDDIKVRPKGTGLGLAICREIVQHFGGRIWVEDAELGGAALCFMLPVAAAGDLEGRTAAE